MIAWRVTSAGRGWSIHPKHTADFPRFMHKPFAFKQNSLRFVPMLSRSSHARCAISPLSSGLLAVSFW
jgi:hypothetical protein